MKNEANSADGLVSTMLNSAAAVSTVAAAIPLLADVAIPTAVSLRTMADLASSFGYAKPVESKVPTRTFPSVHTSEFNTEGASAALVLGASPDNAVTIMSGFAGAKFDEMAFDYVLSRWACIYSGQLSTTDTGALTTKVYGCEACPANMWFNTTGGGRSAWSIQVTGTAAAGTGYGLLPAPVCYLANTFALWRGCFMFRIKIAKTKFHTGRLMICYVPYDPSANNFYIGPPTAQNISVDPSPLITQEYQSSIWDLREGNEFVVEVPFLSPAGYLPCSTAACSLGIWVLDSLQCPTTVATTIPFVVEVCCKPGFELAGPISPILQPAPFSGTTLVAQSNWADFCTDSMRDSTMCIGEHVRSVKSLISRSSCFVILTPGERVLVKCLPWFMGTNVTTWGTGSEIGQVVSPSQYTPGTFTTPCTSLQYYYSQMYAYARGGTNFHIPSTVSAPVWAALQLIQFAAPNGPYIGSGSVCCTAFGSIGIPGHFKLPYYSPLPTQLVGGTDSLSCPARAYITFSNGALWMSAADDSQLGYFLGAPALAVAASNSPSAIPVSLSVGDNFFTSAFNGAIL